MVNLIVGPTPIKVTLGIPIEVERLHFEWFKLSIDDNAAPRLRMNRPAHRGIWLNPRGTLNDTSSSN